MDFTYTQNLMIIGLALLLSIISTNLIHGLTAVDCKDHNVNIGMRIVKSTSDSLIQYGTAALGAILIKFIPFIGMALSVVNSLPIPYLPLMIETVIWGLGFMMGYLIVNMYDVNYLTKKDYCSGKFQTTRLIIGMIMFALGFIYEWYSYIF